MKSTSFFFIKGNKRPHFGELSLKEDTLELEFRSKTDEEQTEQKKAKKIIDLNGTGIHPSFSKLYIFVLSHHLVTSVIA